MTKKLTRIEAIIERVILVEFALVYDHITLEEAGLHFADAVKEIDAHCQKEHDQAVKEERRAERERVIKFIGERRDACRMNDEEVTCRLCLSELIATLKRGELPEGMVK